VKLTLASGSPRRRALLGSIGLELEVRPSDVDETPRPGEDPVAYARRLAASKVLGVEGWALAADTVVHRDGRIWGKPEGPDDAVRMLEALSGRAHTVTTGVALGPPDRRVVFAESTEVVFRDLLREEILAYVASGEPLDKAGAYGIQGGAAGFVRQIDGSYTNVVGLPLSQVVEQLRALGFPGIEGNS
jgi:septum formation protein